MPFSLSQLCIKTSRIPVNLPVIETQRSFLFLQYSAASLTLGQCTGLSLRWISSLNSPLIVHFPCHCLDRASWVSHRLLPFPNVDTFRLEAASGAWACQDYLPRLLPVSIILLWYPKVLCKHFLTMNDIKMLKALPPKDTDGPWPRMV